MLGIIIPTLNEEKYIGKLLENLNQQSYKDFEIIIIDAGSTDKTSEVISKTSINVPLRFINLDVKNVSMQRNKGASMANGDLLLFLDADVEFAKQDALEKLVKAFDKDIVAATTKVKVHPLERKFIDSFFSFFINVLISFLNKIRIGDSRGACQIVKKEYFDSVKYNTKMHVGEDVELFMKLAKKGKILYLGDVTVYESARRYRKEGYIRIMFKWLINGIWALFKKESYAKEWKDVR